MKILNKAKDGIDKGYARSPTDRAYKATFSELEIADWLVNKSDA